MDTNTNFLDRFMPIFDIMPYAHIITYAGGTPWTVVKNEIGIPYMGVWDMIF